MTDIRIRTIALDLDGTLVDSNGRLMPKTKESLLELQDKGIHIILVSGRPYKSMLGLAKELELDKHHGLIISYNGAMGLDIRSMKIVYLSPLDKDLAIEVLNSIEGRPIHPMVDDGDYFLVNDVYKGVVDLNGKAYNAMEVEARAGGYLLKEVDKIQDYIGENTKKILTIVEPEIIQEYTQEYKERFKDRLHVVITSPYFMEFTKPEVNKAYGLKKLGIDPETLMAFGDSMNDLEMLEYAKYGISMGNSNEEVRKASVYTTDDNNSEGVYKGLRHFGLVK